MSINIPWGGEFSGGPVSWTPTPDRGSGLTHGQGTKTPQGTWRSKKKKKEKKTDKQNPKANDKNRQRKKKKEEN